MTQDGGWNTGDVPSSTREYTQSSGQAYTYFSAPAYGQAQVQTYGQYGQAYGAAYGQTPYAAPGYPASGNYGYAPPPRTTNGLAIAALVTAFIMGPVAIVLGVIARRQIRETGEDGDGLALAGLIIGIVKTSIIALVIIAYIVFFVIVFAAAANG